MAVALSTTHCRGNHDFVHIFGVENIHTNCCIYIDMSQLKFFAPIYHQFTTLTLFLACLFVGFMKSFPPPTWKTSFFNHVSYAGVHRFKPAYYNLMFWIISLGISSGEAQGHLQRTTLHHYFRHKLKNPLNLNLKYPLM